MGVTVKLTNSEERRFDYGRAVWQGLFNRRVEVVADDRFSTYGGPVDTIASFPASAVQEVHEEPRCLVDMETGDD